MNGLPYLPILACLNKTGPGIKILIITDMIKKKGDNKNNPIEDAKMSKILLVIYLILVINLTYFLLDEYEIAD
jgi:hypothetical protein